MAYLLGLYEKSMPNDLTLTEKLQAGKKAGFDFMEISIDETDEKLNRLDWSKGEKKQLIRAMYEVGMPIKTMCLSGHRKYPLGSNDEPTAKRGVEIMKKAINFACDIGIRIIQIAGYDVYYEKSSYETIARFDKNLQESVQYASKKGVLLGFETMETEFMNTVEKAMKYVKRMNSPYLNVYPDVGNITNAALQYHRDVLEDIFQGEGKIIAAHLKETVPGKFREIPFGTGHVEFKQIVQLFQKMGVNLFMAEFWYTGISDWEEELKKTNDFLRSKF